MLYRRHIFFSVFGTALCTIGAFLLLFLAGNAFRDLLGLLAGGRVGITLLLRTLWTFLPFAFAYALPLGAVLAVLATIGRMAADGEILALEAAGVSRWQIAVPIFALACLGCLLSLSVTLFAAPRALYGYRRQLQEFVLREPQRFLRSGQFVREFPGRIFYAGGGDEKMLTDLHIWDLGPDGEPVALLRAARGEFLPPSPGAVLRILLRNGSLESIGGSDRSTLHFEEFALNFTEEQSLSGGQSLQKGIRHMNLFELIAARGSPASEESGPEQRRRSRMAVNFTIQQNLAMAFSIIPLSLIAFHLAARLRRRETALNGLLAIFLCLTYHFISVALSWLRDVPAIRPDFLIWVPNGVLLFLSAGLFFRR
ncbi:MAG: LptF/LptG family permease [Puniceicoccales bacterium]|jgi:lipopolysaccharide export system permease protein|nr:LptF/LptG family permease [Puniceicoccales bacterium]